MISPSKKKGAQYFRANVGAVILNSEGLVLAFERADVPGAWQMPQGGLEQGEAPLDAVKREVKEETGIPEKNLDLVADLRPLLVYELPPEYRNEKIGRGQVQHWFLFRFKGEERVIRPDKKEFNDWKWMPLVTLADETVVFRKEIYAELARRVAQKLSRGNG